MLIKLLSQSQAGGLASELPALRHCAFYRESVHPVFLDRHLSLLGVSPRELSQETLEASVPKAQGLPVIWLAEVMTNVNPKEK